MQLSMSSSRHPELTNGARQQHISAASPMCLLLQWFNMDLLPRVKFAYNATRALGIEETTLIRDEVLFFV
jgi:hypothetical protein